MLLKYVLFIFKLYLKRRPTKMAKTGKIQQIFKCFPQFYQHNQDSYLKFEKEIINLFYLLISI